MLLVDTSVWSLALRRDVKATEPEVDALKEALAGSDVVVTTGLVLQELLQGFEQKSLCSLWLNSN
jgi:predicted nucleic acid-binding protein